MGDVQNTVSQRLVARHGAQPGQRHVLPRPGILVLIALEGRHADSHRTSPSGRTQPHVHLIKFAFRRRSGQGRDQALGESCVPGLRFHRVRVINHNDVEIGPGGQFPPAQLAHGEDAPAAGWRTIAPRRFPFCSRRHLLNGLVCQIRPVRSGITGIDQAVKQSVADQEILFPVIAPPGIQCGIEIEGVVNVRPGWLLTADQRLQQIGPA